MRLLLVILLFSINATFALAESPTSMMIDVEAGDPQSICYGETLDLDLLGASISGDVSDGIWFTTGDGIFLPGGNSNGVFSVTDQYQPGQEDQSNGSFTLILVSDDPDGNGPMVEVSDQVVISFLTAPAIVCNNSINVSLAESCEQEVDVFMLLANPSEPYDKYEIELFDEFDNLIPDNILTAQHLNTDVSFTVGHSCTNNTCSGSITVSDNIAPFLNCLDAEVECEYGVDPESVGLPIPFYAVATSIDESSFLVENFDACGDVTLSFSDLTEDMTCASTGFIQEITRTWTAEDEAGNSSACVQTILVRPLPLSAVMSPPDYDGTDELPLSCDGDWASLPNGNPSPDSTGMPSFPDCGNIDATYTDVEFEECGSGFKVVRQWFVIDWCTTESFNENQVIKILDQEGPVFECPEDLTLSSQGYECASVTHELSFVDTVYDCSEFDHGFKILNLDEEDISLDYLTGGNTIEALPVGEYYLVYIATDVCGNASQCTTALHVIDDSAPFAVCDGYTQVAVGSNGIADLLAISVDDGSFDNCGDITMEVAKMTDECNWGLDFGPKVHFCCDEIGDTTMVAFRVTDSQGLSNTCMVTVFVEDKLPPSIVCPSDLTISCAYYFDTEDLSVFGSVVYGESNVEAIIIEGQELGSDGYFDDNCGASVEEESVIDLDCGAGTITRTFTATDLYGQVASCTQTITIESDNPFLESDIEWPTNFEMNGCDTLQAEPEVTGEPSWTENKCALVASTYEDQYFFISGTACIKVLREWTVIDWCQYEAGENAGIWTYLQEIKLKNNVAPVFSECEDQEVCSYDDDCTSELVTFSAHANDDCTDSLHLLYIWSLDIDDDGTIDESGEGIEFTRELLYGDHRVFWTAEDGCGNSETCNYKVTVRDCKNPTPYCTSSITTTIMPSAGMIQIWASDFDYGSFDNCTTPEDLIFSFSQDIHDTSRTIDCDDIDNGVAQEFTFEMWVTDEHGNQERCEVTFIVQDNGDACPNGTIKGKISGKVISSHEDLIPNVELNYYASIDTFSGMEMTNDLGEFALDTVPEFLKYVFRPGFESNPTDGVNTLDLVLIQRHILEIMPFDNPYDILASDLTGNDKVSSADLLTLRKMILGIISEWPQNIDNWVFIDSSFIFPDMTHPWHYPDSIVVQSLKDTVEEVNFVAVKMGDVNGSYKPQLKGDQEEINKRSDHSIEANILKSKRSEGGYISDIYIEEEGEILDGLQMSLIVPEGSVVHSDYLSPNDYFLDGNVLRIAWVNTPMVALGDEPLLSIVVDTDDNVWVGNVLAAEGYINLFPYSLTFTSSELDSSSEDDVSEPEQLFISYQNPVESDLVLNITRDEVRVEIFDVEGRRVYINSSAHSGDLIIDESFLNRPGIYVVRASKARNVQTLKIVKI